ncbi:TBC25 protein, partial [Hypocryptadius cinnamomeus]|nr:TBC25 protein [Hypocryptadius cinnamomeus]
AGGGASPGGGGGAALEDECEVVRVRVKKNEGQQPPEFRSFAVDPQITSLDVLQHILARAFDLQGKKSFVLSFAARDGQGQDTFVPLLSDGDLANAFTCARPTLRLRLDVRNPPDSPLLEDWDIISPREVAAAEPVPERRSLLAAALPFTQALLAQVGRTLARAQAALAWPEGTPAVSPPPPPPPPCAPLSDADLRSYLGPGGRLLRPQDLRLHVFHGGVEPGLRKVRAQSHTWDTSGGCGHIWDTAGGHTWGVLMFSDVTLATPGDPQIHPDQHLRVPAVPNRVSPCTGGLALPAERVPSLSPGPVSSIQVVWCYLLNVFLIPHLSPSLIQEAWHYLLNVSLVPHLDPPFWAFLAARGAHDLLFCYRWLLLELKREFAFEDALKVLEITWSSLPPAPPPPPEGVPLLGAPLGARRASRGLRERRGLRPRPPRRRRRRRNVEEEERGGEGAGGVTEGSGGGFGGLKGSSGGPEGPTSSSDVPGGPTSSSDSPGGLKTSSDGPEGPKSSGDVPSNPSSSSSSSSCSCSSGSSSSDEEVTVEDDGAPLPPPEELGQGNPFLLFVCLAMLLEQREAVMARAGDYNEVAMHFDRLVRRHHLPRVLRRAKGLFARYLE